MDHAHFPPPGWGCALTLAVFNTAAIGLIALPFAVRNYASGQQALWYRYGPLAFLLIGALAPMAVLITRGRQSSRSVVALTMWMLVVLVLWAGWVFNSGGGV